MDPDHPHPAGFPTTRWTRIARAGTDDLQARAALAELCEAYWYPIYAFIRRLGHSSEAAFDLTQAYFTRLIERGALAAADSAKGRFRAFLRADCSHFLADQRDHAQALKRGGGRPAISLDSASAETRYRLEPTHNETPERLFDRAWALSLLDHAMADVAHHYTTTGRTSLFQALKPTLSADPQADSQPEIAARLGMTSGAVQVALHRMRARFAVALRAHVAATLDQPTPEAIDDEIRGLFLALAPGRPGEK